MQLRINVFSEIVVLEVGQQVTDRSVAVLMAGLGKKISPKSQIQWIFVDARNAQLDGGALNAVRVIKETRRIQNNPMLKKLVFVSGVTEVADFGTLEAALMNCASPDSLLYLEKLKLEGTRDSLRKKNEEFKLKSQGTEKTKASVTEFSPRKLNSYLTKIQNIFKNEIKNLTLSIQKLKKTKPDPQALKELEKEEKRVLSELKKKGIISSTEGGS
jgi:hypothetical protein